MQPASDKDNVTRLGPSPSSNSTNNVVRILNPSGCVELDELLSAGIEEISRRILTGECVENAHIFLAQYMLRHRS